MKGHLTEEEIKKLNNVSKNTKDKELIKSIKDKISIMKGNKTVNK